MKKFWLALLSLGLIMAFSASAFAVDVKVSGEYYAAGLYLNKTNVNAEDTSFKGDDEKIYLPADVSTAFFYQRLRVGTDFIVSPCLKLVTRFDAMERIWGGQRSPAGDGGYTYGYYSAGTEAETQNIAVDIVYIDYTSPIGNFKVGYMPDRLFGTVFGDNGSAYYDGQIQYSLPVGPFTFLAGYSKVVENNWNAVNAGSKIATRTDRDWDSYRLAGIYNFKGGDAGALFQWDRVATERGRADGPWMTNIYLLDPYVKAKIGPVALQAELNYYFGDWQKYEYGGPTISVSALSVFLDATANFGMFNVGGSFAYISGDDAATNDKLEGYLDINNGGLDWNPCLIMFNNETVSYWIGGIGGYDDKWVNYRMNNAWFFQGRAGVKPTPQLDVMLSVSYAQADQKSLWGYPVTGGTYGTEVDITGTYKITNNLSYMLGFGYLFTGDFFKGYDEYSNREICDDYIIINKLTLTF